MTDAELVVENNTKAADEDLIYWPYFPRIAAFAKVSPDKRPEQPHIRHQGNRERERRARQAARMAERSEKC